MSRSIFINLPVADLAAATAWYEALGARREPRFSDADAACMVLDAAIHVMLLTHARFAHFARGPIADAKSATAMLLALTVETRAAVDQTIARVAAAGGQVDPTEPQDHGVMCSRSAADPDGHVWEILWMDPSAAQAVETDR